MKRNALRLSPELVEHRNAFRTIKQEAVTLADGLSPAAFNRAPAPGAWSAGQCLDHLNGAGYQLLPRLEAALQETQATGRHADGSFRPGWIERLFIRLNGPEPPFKLPAPAGYRPAAGGLDPEHVVTRFTTLQDRLIDCTEAADGLDLSIKIPSPASRWVRLSLGAWLAATAAHEERHLRQARRALL